MSIRKLNPYLNFNGGAARAIALYEKALGATTETLMRWGDMPGGNVPAEHRDRVMHAQLRIGDGVVMVADSLPDRPVQTGENTHVCLDFDDVADLKRRFEALAAGGQVVMAPEETFWGAMFGMLTDAHGVRWMFNCELAKR